MCSITSATQVRTLWGMPKRPKKPHVPTLETARTIGERIVAAYLAKGWNRSQFQRAVGNAYTTIIAWEEDRNVPRGENLRQLSVVLGVSPSWILGEDVPVTEAQYEAWAGFLETDLGRGMVRQERIALGSMRFEPDDPPDAERYTALLYALRGTAKKTG